MSFSQSPLNSEATEKADESKTERKESSVKQNTNTQTSTQPALSRTSDIQNTNKLPLSVKDRLKEWFATNGLQELFATNDFARIAGQFFTTAPIVVTSTYFFDVLYTLKTTGTNVYRPHVLSAYFASNWRLLLNNYGITYKQAGVKNLSYAGGNHIHDNIHDKVKEDTHGEVELTFTTKVYMDCGVAGLTSLGDLLFTNYWANKGVLGKLKIKPEFNGFSDRIKFTSLTAPARFMSLYTNYFGYMVVRPILNEPMEKLFSSDQYGVLGSYFTNIVIGLMAGFFGNGFDVIRNNQFDQEVKRNNQFKKIDDFIVSSFIAVGEQIYKKHGLWGFIEGTGISSLRTIVAYIGMKYADDFFKEMFHSEVKNKPWTNSKAAFFQSKISEKEPPVEQEPRPPAQNKI